MRNRVIVDTNNNNSINSINNNDNDNNNSRNNVNNNKNGTSTGSTSTIIINRILIIVVSIILYLQVKSPDHDKRNNHRYSNSSSSSSSTIDVTSITSLRTSDHHSFNYDNNIRQQQQQTDATTTGTHDSDWSSSSSSSSCRWYLAESSISSRSGLGVYTAIGLHKDDIVGIPDICIFVSDPPKGYSHLRTHTFGQGSFFGQYEGQNMDNRAACEGFTTIYNTVPTPMINTRIISPIISTTAGLHRAVSPSAGSISYHYGIHGQAIDIIQAGSELTIHYGDWDFTTDDKKKYLHKPIRSIQWLQQYGWCIDNIEIQKSTIRHAGRGAFARRSLEQGTIIAPAPLQVYPHRKMFTTTEVGPEQLFVNYCIQPYNTNMLLYPYGPAVNLINHHHTNPNVAFQWSKHTNHLHHMTWLDLSLSEFWKIVSPGGLILEVIALRDIMIGEELLLDYGLSWENAWLEHIRTWEPIVNASQYVYASEMDETQPIRTIHEQQNNPYPINLATMCVTPDWVRTPNKHITWYDPTTHKVTPTNDTNTTYTPDREWFQMMTYCHILERNRDVITGDDLYTVSLFFSWTNIEKIFSSEVYERPMNEQYIDYNVPRRAIRFIEKPYTDDEHLHNVFRHPIELPDYLTPTTWKETTKK